MCVCVCVQVAKTTPLDGCDGCEVELGFNENYDALRPQVRMGFVLRVCMGM